MSKSSSNDSTETGPVFFWREFEQPYGFLSQWYESTFEHEGVNYTSTEMWMMYQKARLFGDKVCLHMSLNFLASYLVAVYIVLTIASSGYSRGNA